MKITTEINHEKLALVASEAIAKLEDSTRPDARRLYPAQFPKFSGRLPALYFRRRCSRPPPSLHAKRLPDAFC